MKRNHRQGTSATVVALTSTLMFAMGAVVIDLGYARVVKAELQTASDAATVAAVRRVDGTAAGLARARTAAVNIAAMNVATMTPVVIDGNTSNSLSGDVVSGNWNAGVFTATTVATEVNAFRVRPQRPGLASAMSLIGVGRRDVRIAAKAVAVQGARSGAAEVGYYLPFGVPTCRVDALSKEAVAAVTWALNPAGVDNTGWGLLGLVPSASALSDHLVAIDSCMRAYDRDGFLEDTCVTGTITDPLNLGNGVSSSVLSTLADAVSHGVPWNSSVWGPIPDRHSGSAISGGDYGNTVSGPIPVFQGDASYCSSKAKWNETLPIVGFIWGSIYDVRSSGSATQKNIWLKVDATTFRPLGLQKGGRDYGIVWVGPSRLVQ